MVAAGSNVESARDVFLGDLTEAALAAAARHGVKGTSVDLELELWNALQKSTTRGTSWDDRLARWTEAAYRVVLGHGFTSSFVDLKLDIWDTLHRVVRVRRFLPGTVGTSGAVTRLSGIIALR